MKNFYKKSLKIFNKFNAISEQGKPLKENKITSSINKIYDLHNNELILENNTNQNVSLRQYLVFDNHISQIPNEDILSFPNFILRRFITYKTKNTSFDLMLLPNGYFVHKFVNDDLIDVYDELRNQDNSDYDSLTGYWALDKNKLPSKQIHFSIDTISYIGETKVSQQMWDDIMTSPSDQNRKEKKMNITYKRYLSRYSYQTKEINELVGTKKRRLLSKKFNKETIDEMFKDRDFLKKSLKDASSQFKKDFKKNIPIKNITFFDCITFCNKLSVECGLIPYYDDIYLAKDSKLKFKPNYQSNGFRLPFALEWFYAFARGFEAYKNKSLAEIGAFEIDSSVEFTPIPFKHLKYSDENEKLGNGLCDLKILKGKNYLTSEEIRYSKIGKPNSLGLYDMFSQLGETLGEISYYDPLEYSDDGCEHSIFEMYLMNLRKNKTRSVSMSQYISQVEKSMIDSYQKMQFDGDFLDLPNCQFVWLDLAEISRTMRDEESSIVDIKDYKIKDFDDSNLYKDFPDKFELGLSMHYDSTNSSFSSGDCVSLRIVKNIPR